MWGNGPGQQAPSWMNEDGDASGEAAAVPRPTSAAATAGVGGGTAGEGAKSGGGRGWFSGFNKPRNTDSAAPQATITKAAASAAVSAAANNMSIQGKNPSYESEEAENSWAPSWSRPTKYAPSSPDVEAARPTSPSTTSATATSAASPSSGTGPTPLDIDPAVLIQMQKAHWATRILYMTACIIMGAAAGLSLSPSTSYTSGSAGATISQNQGTATNNVGAAFFAVYVLFFCLLMCCFEVGINMFSSVLAINFGFLYSLSGRLLFILFVGFMSFSLSQFGIAAMAYLYFVGVIHIGIMLYYPKFSEWVRQKDYFGSRAIR